MKVRAWRATLSTLAVTGLLAATACAADPAAPQQTPDTAHTNAIGTAARAGGAVVHTDNGAVRGSIANRTRAFQGIPYAAPPVGKLRWQDPKPVTPWTGVRDATKPASSCAQNPGSIPDGSGSEDCLYLNVTTPSGKPSGPKPVVVWLPGGAFIAGTANGLDPKRWVERGDVIVVTANYRLGMLGNFGYPGLAGSGDFALRDQQAVLRWVQRNIAAFGGNPGNVTLAGQSSGAMSTCAHLTAPGSAGLFHKAIMASGACEVSWLDNFDTRGKPAGPVFRSRSAVEAAGEQAARELGCTGAAGQVLDCLRALGTDKLKPVLDRFAFPAYGTPTLPADPAEALATGRFARVPIISGNVHDEATLTTSTYDNGTPITDRTYDAVLSETFGADRPKVEAEYPRSAYGSAAEAWAAIVTDRKWLCTQYDSSRRLARHTSVHQYEFADPAPPPMWAEPPAMPMGSYHSSDQWSLFDLGGIAPPFTPDQQHLAEQIIDYLSAFAATGNPGPGWPAFRDGDEPPYTQTLAPGSGGIHPVDLAAEHHCGFWAGLGR
ncbi:carboxylesterase family protein [Amycolatopsis ultiminotia]|uniref:Carboxylic ester hydrolase n=1 Tax=Amycolatopsis ultiminotia TaxID=543629 RepID=A0ABP6W8I8_9PSEU